MLRKAIIITMYSTSNLRTYKRTTSCKRSKENSEFLKREAVGGLPCPRGSEDGVV